MRKFRNLPKSKQVELDTIFSGFDALIECRESHEYEHLVVFVFDHWLSREEAIKEIDSVAKENQQSRDKILYKFSVALFNSTECYLVKLRGKKKEKITYREFTSGNAAENVLQPLPYNCGDKWRNILVLPSLSVVYFEGSDFTHYVYYKNVELLSDLTGLAESSGLYILK